MAGTEACIAKVQAMGGDKMSRQASAAVQAIGSTIASDAGTGRHATPAQQCTQ